MTPEEHIEKSEEYLSLVSAGRFSAELLNAWANAARGHIEMARYQKDFPDPLRTDA